MLELLLVPVAGLTVASENRSEKIIDRKEVLTIHIMYGQYLFIIFVKLL